MKRKINKAKWYFSEGYKAAVIDMLREGFLDDANQMRALMSFGGDNPSKKSKDGGWLEKWKYRQGRTGWASRGASFGPEDYKWHKDHFGDDAADVEAFKQNDVGREIDNEFAEPDFFSPKALDLGKPYKLSSIRSAMDKDLEDWKAKNRRSRKTYF